MKIKVCLMIVLIYYSVMAFGQSKLGAEMTTMLDLSRPSEMHQILHELSGSWHFQDAKLSFVKGTLVRTSTYDDRFFNVQIIGGKLQYQYQVE